MRSTLVKMVGIAAIAALPARAFAAPVNYATYLDVNGVQSQFVQPSDSKSFNSPTQQLLAEADLAAGELRAYNAGNTGGGATQSLFYDTLTFDGSAFGGTFGTSYNLTLTASFEGTFSGTGIQNGAAGGRIHIYDGATTIDSSVFASSSALLDFMFCNGPAPLCAQGVAGPDFSTFQGSFAFSVSCTVTVTAANPTVRFLMNLPVFINTSGGSWTIDMLNTATLDLGDLGGRVVHSASGVLPGTASAPTPVPEPTSLILMGTGLAANAARRRRRGFLGRRGRQAR